MSPAIIAALITGGLSIVGIIVTTAIQSRALSAEFRKQSELADQRIDAKLDQYQAVTNEKIDELSRRVEKHNNVVERTYRLEQDSAVHTEQIKVANHRIDDLEAAGVRLQPQIMDGYSHR